MKNQLIVDIQKNISERNNKRKETYKVILNKTIKQIKKMTSFNIYYTFFQIPEFIIGYPLYPLEDCIIYVQKKLVENGFLVKYYFPNILYICWDKEELNIKNSNDFSNANNCISHSSNANNKKFINSISSYKPSGKVVLNLT